MGITFKNYLGLLIIAGALGIASCHSPSAVKTDNGSVDCRWTQSGGGPERAAYADVVSGTPQLEWKRRLGSALFFEPTISGGVIFAPAADKEIYLISSGNGDILSSLKIGNPVLASCPVDDSLIVVNSDGTELIALNWLTRKAVWKVEIRGKETEPAIYGDRIYWVGSYGALNCFSLSEGKRLWDTRLQQNIVVSPTACSLGVLVIDDGGEIKFFSADDGRLLWNFTAPSRIRNSPVISGDFLVYCTADGAVGKVRLQDGIAIWGQALRYPVMAPLACDGRGIFIGTNDNRLIRLDFESGAISWNLDIDGPVKAGACVAGDISIFASLNHTIYFVDKNTGDIVSRYETDGMVSSRPSVCDNRVFVAGEDKYLYCFRIAGEK